MSLIRLSFSTCFLPPHLDTTKIGTRNSYKTQPSLCPPKSSDLMVPWHYSHESFQPFSAYSLSDFCLSQRMRRGAAFARLSPNSIHASIYYLTLSTVLAKAEISHYSVVSYNVRWLLLPQSAQVLQLLPSLICRRDNSTYTTRWFHSTSSTPQILIASMQRMINELKQMSTGCLDQATRSLCLDQLRPV